jgi:iron complex transport system permease protein
VKRTAGLILCVAVTALTIALSITIGAVHLALPRVFDALRGIGSPIDRSIVVELRLPRALLAALAGGGLAVSGTVFQALLRNPLADPYVLGVSAGAALGAVLATVLGLNPALLPVAALLGSAIAIAAVFTIALRATYNLDARVLLLAGAVLSALFQALILLLLTSTTIENFRSAIFWMMGSVATASWRSVALLVAYSVPAWLVLFALARPLNLLSTGDETALYLGLRVESVKRLAYFVASVLVGASVASCGAIGFIGLVVPHAIRIAWSSDHRVLLPASLLLGGAFLVVCDTVARTVVSPAELPVGVVTAVVGVPFFIALLIRRAV